MMIRFVEGVADAVRILAGSRRPPAVSICGNELAFSGVAAAGGAVAGKVFQTARHERSPPGLMAGPRPAAVRIAAEQLGVRFPRRIMHFERAPVGLESVRMLLVNLRQRANAKRREEFILVKRILQHALQPLELRDRQQQALSRLTIAA